MKKKIGFISSQDPRDKKAWSGTYHKMVETLEQYFEVVALGPIPKSNKISGLLARIDKLHQFLFRKKYNREHNYIRSKYYASVLNKRLKQESLDLVFAPASTSELAFLKTNLPICKLEDATFKQLISYYDDFSTFSKLSISEAKIIDKKAVKKASFHVFSSTWAQNSLVADYHISKEKTAVVKFGANINHKPSKKEIENREYSKTIQLLFLGKYWKRKGGDIAFQIFKELLQLRCDVHFTVCGCIPPVQHEKMTVIPFLNKNNPKEFKAFNKVLYSSHLLLLPTKADCTPIVFCEANAYGLPVITTLTGGVGSVIENNVNGYALAENKEIKDYVDAIESLINDRRKLQKLALSSRNKYEEELNWNVWGAKMQTILNDLIR